MAALSCFPRGKKRKTLDPVAPSSSSSCPEPAAETLFGKRGLPATLRGKTEDSTPRTKKVKLDSKHQHKVDDDDATARILTFKNVRKGMLVLGCVRQVTPAQEVLMSLPNKLHGVVARAECSDEFYHALQAATTTTNPSRDDDQLPPLATLFPVGQLLPCIVLHTSKTDKHKVIHLSLRLSLIHAALSPSSLHKGTCLYATVSSLEDHGVMLNVGIRGVHAFVPQQAVETPNVVRGQHVLVTVVDMDTFTNTATVSLSRDHVVKSVTRGDTWTMQQLVPGMLLNVRVAKLLTNGLRVTFLSFFHATVEHHHLSRAYTPDWQASYREGMKARARIVSMDPVRKHVTLSMAPHIVHLNVPASPFPVGTIVPEATIERMDRGIGMLLSLPCADQDVEARQHATSSRTVPAYVHISNASTTRVDKLEKHFTIGQRLACRVVGFSPFDAMVTVSCNQDLLAQTVLRHDELVPGAKFHGKIVALESWGMLIELSEGVRGLVPRQHMPAGAMKQTTGRGSLQVGKRTHVRVLHVDHDAKKTVLTMKLGLVTSDLPVLSSYQDATAGLLVHGFITKLSDYGVIVTFYSNVYGLVPMDDLHDAGIDDIEQAYSLGQVVKTRIVRCDVTKQRLLLSLNVTCTTSTRVPERVADVVGTTIVDVTITSVDATCFQVKTPDGRHGVLPFVHLTDFPRETSLVDALVARVQAGGVIHEPLLVVAQDTDDRLMLSKKPLLLAFAAHRAMLPRTFQDVRARAVVMGVVTSVHASKGVFVTFLNHVVGLAPRALVKEAFVAEVPRGMFESGETVTCVVEKVDDAKKQFVLSFHARHFVGPRRNGTTKARPAYFQAYLREQAAVQATSYAVLRLGTTVEAEFVSVRPYGAVFVVDSDKESVSVVVPSTTDDKHTWSEAEQVTLLLTDYDFTKKVYYGRVDDVPRPRGSIRKRKPRRQVHDKVTDATVVAIGATNTYVIVSWQDPDTPTERHLGVVGLCDFWCPSNTSSALGIELATSLSCRVVLPSLHMSDCATPFEDLMLLAIDDEHGERTSPHVPRGLSSLPAYSSSDFVLGRLVTGVVASISERMMEIRVKTTKATGKVRALVSLVDVDEMEGTMLHPFDRYAVDTKVHGRVIAVTCKGANKRQPVSETNPATFHTLQLSLRADDVAGDETIEQVERLTRPEWLEGSAGRALLHEGASIVGVVCDHSSDHLRLQLSSSVSASLSCVDVSTDLNVVRAFQREFPVGTRVQGVITCVDPAKQVVDVSLIRSHAREGIEPGKIVNGVITTTKRAIRPPSLMVQLGAHTYGRACITELLSTWKTQMLELPEFASGQVVPCLVLSTRDDEHIDVSLRPEALATPHEYLASTRVPVERNVGDLVVGIVASTTSRGCFVRVDRDTTARVMLRELSDDFVPDPMAQFPPGTLVAGRVTHVSERGLELSLKASVVSDDVVLFQWSDLKEGMTVKGTITKIQAYGVFVRIEQSHVSGLCHVSEIADDKVTQPLDAIFAVGDYVKAKVLKVEDRRVSFGLKPSYFEDEESSSESEAEEEEDEEERASEGPEVSKIEAREDDEEERAREGPEPSTVEASEDEASDDDHHVRAAPVDFTWDGFSSALQPPMDDQASSCEAVDDPVVTTKARKQARDEWVARREQALAKDDHVPQSASDYERLVAVSPQSSYVWIQYMAFHVGVTEIELARDVAARATSALSFRDEKEKLNVWLAWLNLEHEFGDEPSFERVVTRALQVNPPKRVYLHVVDLHARANAHAHVERTLATMQKKFGTSKQTWLRALAYWSGRHLFQDAAETLQRSLQRLPPHKHVRVILSYGQLLFEHGQVEKARTILEGLVATYPKRLDLWNVYLDKEIKFGHVAMVRALFDRLVAMDFAPKKMKFLFKKYLEFEETQGDATRVAHVQTLAKEFVARVAAK
ncbi:hypothetical protein PsorP6_013429 [Peronosclerospora sorghi]|uniref:Uncharacterized protein n=1 Tax=Peronosclerospora sorghi TaxID=230839 RepID=A0ACC0VG77_9STRA|nr:hypothetical protein PsorP6_013429 [Peronosclerospora sorghi]